MPKIKKPADSYYLELSYASDMIFNQQMGLKSLLLVSLGTLDNIYVLRTFENNYVLRTFENTMC